MAAEPFSWSVVAVGSWNLAILSPDGIRRRMFQLPDGTALNLELAVDRPGQFRVAHEGIIVTPSAERVEVISKESTPDGLEKASVVCSRILTSLPETPVSAIGVNVRYKFDEVPDAMLDLVSAKLDAAFSDAGQRIIGSATRRSLLLDPGRVNVQLIQEGAGGTLEFNFHRDSVVPAELVAWLTRSREFIAFSDRMLDILGAADARREVHA